MQTIKAILSEAAEESEVALRGWIHRTRGSAKMRFITVRDGSGIIQCTIKAEGTDAAEFELAKSTLMEASVIISGTVHADERAPGGREVRVTSFVVQGAAEAFPIQRDQSPEHLLDNRHLWVRSRKMNAMLKVRSTVFGAIHEYFRSQDFYETQSPILTGAAGEGGSSVFTVEYFEREAYLAQTWQLHAEAMVHSLEKIYTVAPSFRAEKSKTSRHLTEYWHAEMEMAWAGLPEIMEHTEGLIAHICKTVAETNPEELAMFEREPAELLAIQTPFPRITYDDALELLKTKGMDIPYGKDLRTVEEEVLSKEFDRPLFVTHYPEEIMAFYKPEDPENPGRALCFDLLGPEGYGEIVGGSARDNDMDRMLEKLRKGGEKVENYSWYLDIRRYGAVPHAGFGLGVERIIRWILKLEHIRDAIGFPRLINRVEP